MEDEPPPLTSFDEPPPLDDIGASSVPCNDDDNTDDDDMPTLNEPDISDENGPSLRDLMEEESLKAIKKKDARRALEEERRTKTFGTGMKSMKGFFNKAKERAKGRSNKKRLAVNCLVECIGLKAAKYNGCRGTIREFNEEKHRYKVKLKTGKILLLKPDNVRKWQKTDSLPTLKKAETAEDPLRMAEVQNAMKNAGTYFKENTEWVTPDLLEKVQKNPKLLRAMQDPRFPALQKVITLFIFIGPYLFRRPRLTPNQRLPFPMLLYIRLCKKTRRQLSNGPRQIRSYANSWRLLRD